MNDEDLQAKLLKEFSDSDSDKNIDVDKNRNTLSPFVFLAFIFLHGIQNTSNVIYVPDDKQLYLENGFNKTLDAIRFRCYQYHKLSCDAKVFLRKDGKLFQKNDGNFHSHEDQYITYVEMKCMNGMKEMCKTAPASTTPREIYDQCIVKYVFS